MNESFDATPAAYLRLLWTTDPGTQIAILAVLGLTALALCFVYGPLCLRLVRIAKLQRSIAAAFGNDSPRKIQQREIAIAFDRSPLVSQWREFLQRWRSACAADPDASTPDESEGRAPVCLADIFDEHPALPMGAVRSLLPALPGLFLATGLLGTFAGLTLAIPEVAPSLGRDQQIASIAQHVGMALRSSLWGLALSIAAAFAARWIEGRFEAQSESLDLWVKAAYGSITTGELNVRAAHAQRLGFDRLRAELLQVTEDLTDSIDTGLRRIEQSTAKAASLVSEEQRSELGKLVAELAQTLKRGLQEHLHSLHNSLQKAVEHQNAVTGGLSHAFEQLVENSEIHERTSESLMRTADSVRRAAEAIDETATDFRPLLEGLKQTGSALSETASRIQATQESSAQTAEAVATSVELSRHALDSQHRLLETSLDEIRSTLGLLSRGLGENLSRALRGVDSALDLTVGRLRKTILESNETIDRMTIPIRATETTVLEMRAALDQVRADIVSLNDWLIRIAEPVRDTLAQLDDKATFLTRALQEFGDRARSVEHDMDELRGELRATGRSHPGADRARAGAALELEEPSRETEYAAGAEAESAEQEEAEAEEVAGHEEDTELATPGPEPETEIAAAASDAGAASGESRAEDELAQAPAHQQDAKADRANGVPDYRTQAPELFAIMAERSPAATAAISDDYRDTANAGEAECDAEAAEAVSLSGLLSRPRLAEPDQPVATAAEKQDGTPADSAAAGDEDQPHADSRRTFRRLFGSKS